MNVTKEGQNLQSNPFSKHEIDNIKISILKIVPNKAEWLIGKNKTMVKFGTFNSYGLHVMFNF